MVPGIYFYSIFCLEKKFGSVVKMQVVNVRKPNIQIPEPFENQTKKLRF
jgi:hypothetical protein